MKRIAAHLITALLLTTPLSCASLKSMMGSDPVQERQPPINNPFNDYYYGASAGKDPIILRTKKGDRSVEVELSGSQSSMTDFVVPMSPNFQDGASRSPASDGAQGVDERYMTRGPSISDREITTRFAQGTPATEGGRREVETGLGVIPAEDETPVQDKSYLAAIDHVKQLYKLARYEAALLETDEMLRLYPTDARLYEMRGTLFDRIGRTDLAMKSWSQALRFDPGNESLRKFMERKQQKRSLASP